MCVGTNKENINFGNKLVKKVSNRKKLEEEKIRFS